ncbi:MFS transporter [Nonomuraea angiospora]|uniref:MFS transporter n=1 Tax=Nonomuraea angiospora TaxID=46172 RepID=UPI00331C763F
MPAWLLALVFTMFTFATDDYVIAGVLPEVSADLGVSVAAGGQLVTAFSLAFALGAPVASVVSATWSRRGLFTWALALFTAANWAAAFTTSYAVLMGLRVLAALAAAAVVPAVYALATSLAPEERRGRYLALVMGGMTGSLMLGVPVGTWVGGAFGWQATFGLGGLLGLVALVAIRATLPESPPAAAMPVRERLAPLARPQVLLGLLGVVGIVLGSMMLMTYLAPFLRDLAGAGPAELGWVFALAGLAGLAGGQLGGWAADRWGADPGADRGHRRVHGGDGPVRRLLGAAAAAAARAPAAAAGVGGRVVVDPAARADPAARPGRPGRAAGAGAQQQRRLRRGLGRGRGGRARSGEPRKWPAALGRGRRRAGRSRALLGGRQGTPPGYRRGSRGAAG